MTGSKKFKNLNHHHKYLNYLLKSLTNYHLFLMKLKRLIVITIKIPLNKLISFPQRNLTITNNNISNLYNQEIVHILEDMEMSKQRLFCKIV